MDEKKRRIVPRSGWEVVPTDHWFFRVELPGRGVLTGRDLSPAAAWWRLRSGLLRLLRIRN